MRIGGLQKNSLIDYPGKVSCVVFLSGCNFQCPYCHNPELARGGQDNLLPYSSIMGFIQSHKSFLDGVVISGGEPTLQSDLMCLCEDIKRCNLPIKLDTNGSNPSVINELISNKMIDYIAMDVKTSISPKYVDVFKSTKTSILDIEKSIDLIMGCNLESEFRTTCVKYFINHEVMGRIGRSIKGTKRYFLQKPNLSNVLMPKFFDNAGEMFSDEEMAELKTIAEKYVGSCIIR